ncbi:NF-kappa-B inhibitor epsilon [Ophiophagus hannah]|uniref:NF-kappa-B inhibitor epsilon n=1 Tax=Ophiophagus hannah TaxID=8665 RepID=V8P109_OPHHA|nr:NF-kappa-B inhibitor epsilon [Ophiophagus hannah]
MSEIRSYGEKKEMLLEGGGAYLEEGQCDSGIEFSRSLHGQPGEAELRSPAAGRTPLDKLPGSPSQGKEEPADERLDSSYGSSSIVESLTGLQGEPSPEKEEDDEEEEEERLRQQLLETLAFLSEDGDTCDPAGISAYEFVFQLDIGYPMLVDQRYGGPVTFLPQKFKVLDQLQEGEESHGALSQWLGLTTELDTLLFLKRDPEGHLTSPELHINVFFAKLNKKCKASVDSDYSNVLQMFSNDDMLLHLAIIHCMPSIAFCCIAQMPVKVLEFQNDLFQTPLHLSVYLEQFEVVKALILKGVNTALQDRNGNTALHLACEQQSLECVELLLPLKKPISEMQTRKTLQDLQLQNWQGLTCLHISTLKGNLQLMALLVQNGADINVQDGTSGKTPLHLAVENHDEMAVRHLLRLGAQVDSQMYNGCTPLHLAVGRNNATIAAILCHSGADTLLRNMENETAQDLADGNDDILTLLPFDDLKISGKPVMCSSRTS